MCGSLQLLASPVQAQLSHFPAGWVVLTDEMVLDFDQWIHCVSTYWKLSKEQMAKLTTLDEFLSEMSGSPSSDLWTDEALSSDPRWEGGTHFGKSSSCFFWMAHRDSPPAREENGMLVDNGSYFIKSGLPS
jgi:hypothetical protein